MGTLTDTDLRSLLGEAAASYDVPADGPGQVRAAVTVVPLHRRRRVQLPAAAAVVVLLLLAGTAVFGGDEVDRVGQLAGASQDDAGAAGESGGAGVLDRSSPVEQLSSATGGGTTAGSAVGAAPPVPVAAGAAVVAAPPVDGARIVQTGAIALVVEDDRVAPVLAQVQALATAAGGVVARAQSQESGPTPSGSVVLRVPVARFEQVVAQVRDLDAEVLSATTSGTDVTAQYADVEAQLRTLKAARERFLEILSRARSIGDVLAVQQRVDDVTGQIDRIEGQRRVLADQSDRATLEVSVAERDDPSVTSAQRGGLSQAFVDAWTGFRTGVEGLIRLSGRGVLLLLCLTAAWFAARLVWRASRRRLV